MTAFGPDPAHLRVLWLMLAVEGQFMRVSWSPGTGLAPAGVPAIVDEESLAQRLVAEFDATEMFAHSVPASAKVAAESAPVDPMVSYDVAAADVGSWLALVGRMCEDRDVVLSAGARRARGHGTCMTASVLWARVEGKKQEAALRRFRPSPSMVIREGSTTRRVALWALEKPLSYDWLVRGNKRIAHKLFAAKKWGDAEFVFPAPGSCLRVGRARPVPVSVEFFDPRGLYKAREVVGRLQDAPDANAWREARAA